MIAEVARAGKKREGGRMLQSFSGPKYPNACGFCFTRRCWSCTSPGAWCSWAVTCGSPCRRCSGQQLSLQRGMCHCCFRSRQRHLWCWEGGDGPWQDSMVLPHVLCHGHWCPRRDLEGNAWSPWSGLCASVHPKMRPSSCAAKTLKMPMTSALTNSNNLLLLSLKLAKYFTPS